jgi:hypothetical protein
MRLRHSNLVWRTGFTSPNTRKATKPRKITAGKAAIHKALVLTTESIEQFEAIYSACYADHQPQGEIESALVNEIATAHWRVLRMQRAETETIDAHLSATGNAPGALAQALFSQAAEALRREEDRCSRQMIRTSAALRKRKAAANQ